VGFVGIIVLSCGIALWTYYSNPSYLSTTTDLGFWILFIAGACFSLVINTFALVLAPTLDQHGGMAHAGLLLGWDLVVFSTYITSLVFNSWPISRLSWGDEVVGNSGTTLIAEKTLTAVYAFNCILFLVYVALIAVDCKRVRRHQLGTGVKLGSESRGYEPSIEMPIRGTMANDAEASGGHAKFVPSVRSAEGASSQQGRDFV